MLEDKAARDYLEADLHSEYGVDLLDLYREDRPLTLRKLVVLIEGLPAGSRSAKHSRNDPLSTTEHLMITVIDCLNTVAYQASITAAGTVGGEDYRKVMRDAPEPIERPTIYYEQPEEEYEFTSIKELQSTGLFG